MSVGTSAQLVVDEPTDTVRSQRGKGFFGKVLRYFDDSNKVKDPTKFDFSVVGGPHYSKEVGFGLGILASGNYHTDVHTAPSNVSLFFDITTTGSYTIGVTGDHIRPNDMERLSYEIYFNSVPTYFWGIGFDNGNTVANKTKYLEKRVDMDIKYRWRLGDNIFIGPTLRFYYAAARKIHEPAEGEPGGVALWEGERLTTHSYGLGALVAYDTRDNLTAPTRGWHLELTQRFFPRFLWNRMSFSSTEFTASHYENVWKGGILAMRLHGKFNYWGTAPWSMLPTVGGRSDLRGYYKGRYRDNCEADFTLELRQKVWRRNGIAIWGGVGEVFPSFDKLSGKKLLPNYGIGYRWEFKKHVNLRIDLGFGRKQSNFLFSINEAF